MPSRRLISLALTTALAATGVVAVSIAPAVGEPQTCESGRKPVAFTSQYVDETRAGGEPLVATHPDGTLLWGSHAGTTHFYSAAAADPTTAAFLEKYEGQTYQYWSDDGGETWNFSPRLPISNAPQLAGVPNSGFSDPEFAIDAAGNVFISEINLANIAFSKSTDSGRTWTLQNVIGISMTDRQWMEADQEDVLWVVGNTFGGGSPTGGEPVTGSTANRIYKSVDGGVTFSAGQETSDGAQQFNDIKVDQRDGRLFQMQQYEGDLVMAYVPNAREVSPPDLEFQRGLIAEDVSKLTIMGGDIELDAKGNVYAVWDEDGNGARQPGIWYSYSTDRGATWADPVLVSAEDAGTSIWPWISVGDPGRVGISWIQNVDPENPSYAPDEERPAPDNANGPWHIFAALTDAGLGCEDGLPVGFTVQQATPEGEHVHEDTVCNSGTICQAQLIDRRLGDYHSNEVDTDGDFYIAVSDTRQGGAVALPRIIRQVDGEPLIHPKNRVPPGHEKREGKGHDEGRGDGHREHVDGLHIRFGAAG